MTSRPLLRHLVAVTSAACVAAPAAALACGGGVTTADATLEIGQHVAFYAVRETATEVVVQLDVPSASQPFGVILPVQGEPELDPEPVDADDFRRLDGSTRPQIYLEDSGGTGSGSSDSGCGCGDGDVAGGLGGGDGGERNAGVDVLDVADIGPVTAVSFAADDAEALDTWLDENGFVLPTEAQATLEAYVDEGATFIAFRRSDDATAQATSVGVHFTVPATYDAYPLRMAAVGAAAQLGIRVFLATEGGGRAPSAPFTTLTLDDLATGLLREDRYTEAVTQAIAGAGGKAFLVEGVYPPASAWRANQLDSRLAAMTSETATLTRLTAVLDRAALTEDVVFDAPIDEAPTEIYLTTASLGRPRPSPMKWGSLGVFVGGAVAAVIRRRRRTP